MSLQGVVYLTISVYSCPFLFCMILNLSKGGITMFKKIFGQLQRIGKALMLPVAILPAAGLMLGIGAALQTEAMIDFVPFLVAGWIGALYILVMGAGGIVFDFLELLFAYGVFD